MQEQKRRAILYIRVSTDEQARGNSLAHQLAVLERYCEVEGIEVDSVYKEDFSAKTFERPEFRRLLVHAKAHKRLIDLVLIQKWDRFSRNATESYAMLSNFAKIGIEVQAVEQPLDMMVPENRLMLAIYLSASEVENERRGLNVKTGIRRGMEDGKWMNQAPAGYIWERDEYNKPILKVDEDKAYLVKEAFELASTGVCQKEELRRMLVKKGLKTTKSIYPRILSNPLYAGLILVPAWRKRARTDSQGAA